MKQITNYQRAVNYLHKIYVHINEDFFNNSLGDVSLTIQESRGAYGHVTCSQSWISSRGDTRELNISANYLNRDIVEVVATLIHECSHIYNLNNGIRDCSNNNVYHNKKFKKTAEELGKLRIEQVPVYGWTDTYPTEATVDFCIKYGLEDIDLNRGGVYSFGNGNLGTSGKSGTSGVAPKKPSSTRKYICPVCGSSFRATRNLNVLCMDCNVQYELA